MSFMLSSCTSRSVSYSDRNSGMHTHTKVVRLASLNWRLTFSTTLRVSSSLASMVALPPAPPPNMPPSRPLNLPNL